MCLSIAVHTLECVLATGTHLGYQWVVVHNRMGFRCGYVRVDKDHPWFGKEDLKAEVHGGLTFAAPDEPCAKGGADDGYWFGFDCGHWDDAPDVTLPIEEAYRQMFKDFPGTVRTQEYVEAECRSLCEQALNATMSNRVKDKRIAGLEALNKQTVQDYRNLKETYHIEQKRVAELEAECQESVLVFKGKEERMKAMAALLDRVPHRASDTQPEPNMAGAYVFIHNQDKCIQCQWAKLKATIELADQKPATPTEAPAETTGRCPPAV